MRAHHLSRALISPARAPATGRAPAVDPIFSTFFNTGHTFASITVMATTCFNKLSTITVKMGHCCISRKKRKHNGRPRLPFWPIQCSHRLGR